MVRGSRNYISIGLIAILIFLSTADCDARKILKDGWKGFSVSCTGEDPQNVSVSCHGVRIVRRIVQQLLEKSSNQKSVELFDGISLVDTKGGESMRSARVLKGSGNFESIIQFLEGREIRIKLPSFFPDNMEAAFVENLPTSSNQGRGSGGGGGGGKKGDGGAMMMALMMGKMMMAMGFSALGALAMKALMVSSVALMLSLITAVKKLASKDDKDEHHVVYAQEVGHHHSKRSVPINDDLELSPYRGYVDLYATTKSS